MSDPVVVSIHPTIRDKPSHWLSDYADGWQRHPCDLAGLQEAIQQGVAFVPAEMTSTHRSSGAFLHADLAVIDIDEGLDLDQFSAHPLAGSAAFLYTTASHQDKPGAHRFRVIFRLPVRISDPELYKALITLLIREFGGDKSCSDPCRLFYGSSKGQQRLFSSDATLPDEWLERARRRLRDEDARRTSGNRDYDAIAIGQASYVLEHVLHPTADGERNQFVRVTAAAASAGDALYSAWSDWASRGHHGKGKNARQTSERFFRGFSGKSSLGTLFFLASEQDPEWRRSLPEDLRSSGSGPALPAAGYSMEDFYGEPDDLPLAAQTRTQSMFDPGAPAFQAPPPDRSARPSAGGQPDPAFAGDASDDFDDDDDLDDFDDSGDPLRKRRGRSKKSDGENEVANIKAHIAGLYPGLRLNQITLKLEYGPRSQCRVLDDPTLAWVPVSEHASKIYPKTHVTDIAHTMAEANTYNPVRDYLRYCSERHEPITYFNQLASTLLGVHDEGPRNPRMPNGELFADVALRRFLVGAVARAMTPGCSHSWMLILIGPQNLGKSNFFQYLTPPNSLEGTYPWVSTVQQGISYLKDKPHALHAGWLVLLDEVERYFKRQYTEELKNLVSVSVDRSARKWENERSFPRSFVMCGATNSDAFMVDPTGNRRFMPITVLGKVPSPEDPNIRIIDLDRVKADRNRIWAAAYQAYQDNPIHEFSSYELNVLSEYTDSYVVDSPLTTAVRQVLDRNVSFLIEKQRCYFLNDIFEWLKVRLESTHAMKGSICDELRRLGYKPIKAKIQGKMTRYWTESIGARL